MEDIQNLSVRIPKNLHREVKSLCASKGIALQFFIEKAIREQYEIMKKDLGVNRSE